MATESEWAWVAGIIEGEGCLRYSEQSIRGYWSTEVRVRMTDLDIIERLRDVTGVGNVLGPYIRPKPRKPIYEWRVSKKLDARLVLQNVRPWLGRRRGAKADLILAAFPALKPYPIDEIKQMHTEGMCIGKIAERVSLCRATVAKIIFDKPHRGYYQQPLRAPS